MATLIAYPDPDTETTTVDGEVYRSSGTESFANIRANAGTSSDDSATTFDIQLASTSGGYTKNTRCIAGFDTSPIGGGTITSADIDFWPNSATDWWEHMALAWYRLLLQATLHWWQQITI